MHPARHPGQLPTAADDAPDVRGVHHGACLDVHPSEALLPEAGLQARGHVHSGLGLVR